MILFALVLWLLILIGLGYAVDRLWVSISPGRWYRYAIAPGIWVRQISHVFGCFLMGAEVTGITLYDPEGGRVSYGKPFLRGVGDAVIALAPLIGCPLALYLVMQLTGANAVPLDRFEDELQTHYELSLRSFAATFPICARLLADASRDLWQEARARPLPTAIFIYFAAVFTMRMAPTKADWRNSIAGIAVLAAGFLVLAAIGEYGGLRGPYRAVCRFAYGVWGMLSFGVAMLLVIALVSVVVAGTVHAIRAVWSPGKSAAD